MTVDSNVHQQPGHLIRRAHQISVSIFTEECRDYGITPIQFGILYAVRENPGIDQITLAKIVALDRSNTGDVLSRLEDKGLISRTPGDADRRTKLLALTPQGDATVATMTPDVRAAQARMLEPLIPEERDQFMALLGKLVDVNNSLSRAPEGLIKIQSKT